MPQLANNQMAPQTNTCDSVIKATARLQEAHEPPRQKPIIKLDPRHQQELMMAHINEANQLASSIRASIDSGRDNPFRPDGEIYKLTNPIVDYYKFGPNQSRAVTPTYAELDYFSSKNKRKRRAEAAAAAKNNDTRPCWRRWLCCCCCDCFRSRKTSTKSTTLDKHQQHQNGDIASSQQPTDGFPDTAANASPSQGAGDTVRILEASQRVAAKGTDLKEAPPSSVSSSGDKVKTKSDRKKAKKQQTTKKVVLDEDCLQSNGRANEPNAGDKSNCDSHPSSSNQTGSEPKTTKVKTIKTSKCVIS